MYDFDEVIDRGGTNSLKYEAGPFRDSQLPADHIPMWVADMDFACPQPILDAMKARLDRRILGYSMLIDYSYFNAVMGWMERRHGWSVNWRSIVFSSGVVTALKAAVERLTQPGEGVLLNTPAYHPFDDAIHRFGRTPVYSALIHTADGGWEMDYDDLERKAKDPKTTLYFLCSPHNPTGRVWREEELRRVADICIANNVFIVSDEIHADLLRPGQKHIPLAKLYPEEKRILTCTAPSKTFNLAGNHHANLIFSDLELAAQWNGERVCGMPTPLGIDACRAAYDQCEGWVDALNDYLADNFKYMEERLAAELPQAGFRIPEGTYLAWVDLRAFHKSDKELQTLLSKHGLFIEYGHDFVRDAEGFVRINMACPRSTLKKALDILIPALRGERVPSLTPGRLSEGDQMPDFSYCTPFTSGVSLKEGVGGTRTVFLFLRYYGCTLCQLDIHRLKENYAKIAETGGQVKVVLQSDPQTLAAELGGEDALPFEIICDPKGELYRLLGIAPARNMLALVPGSAMEKVAEARSAGLAHGAYEGDELQLPAAFLVEADGTASVVRYGHHAGDTPDVDTMAAWLRNR